MIFMAPSEPKEKYTQDKLIEFLQQGHNMGNHCFVLIYLVGCGPCNMTKPEWKKVAEEFDYRDHDKGIVMVHIDQDNLERIKPVVGNYSVSGFPTMLHVRNNKISSYEDSSVKNKNRSAHSFREWINQYVNMNGVNKTMMRKPIMEKLHRPLLSMSISSRSRSRSQSKSTSSKHSKHSKRSKKHRQTQRGGKWSLKYKRSINCKHPKGFSQKQHCKYGRVRRGNT